MDYISIAQASEKWGIAVRRVQALCAQNRIPELTKFRKGMGNPKGCKETLAALVLIGQQTLMRRQMPLLFSLK